MSGGEMVQRAPPAERYARPATRLVAGFVGDANLVPATASAGGAMTPAGVVPLDAAVDGPALVMLRPEDLRLTAGGDAEVELVEYYGHDTVYVVRPMSGPPLRVRAASAPKPERGASVQGTSQGHKQTLCLPLRDTKPHRATNGEG